MSLIQTAERVSQKDTSDNYVFQRSILAYVEAAKMISGDVLEIGTGSGYGIEIIASSAKKFVTVDKYEPNILSEKEIANMGNVSFIQMVVPPLKGIPDNSFDFVVSFQVIEHIEDDKKFVQEIYRVLKNGGKFIVTTPNKKMSLTRNPWHVREYTIDELDILLRTSFQSVQKNGVLGNDKIFDYYKKNKLAVEKITRFDIFNLQYRLPRQLLQIPYDILNRMNRKKLLEHNRTLITDITMDDYFVRAASDECFDLFYVAEKKS
jgi:ubiquinone/menaquinone biosynthesis C-methylase UbiE